eukprot:1195293-Prorocentrum_minimum.AAC.5
MFGSRGGCARQACVDKWRSPAYMAEAAESAEPPDGRAVQIHVSEATTIDLAGHRKPNTSGNFRFEQMPLGTFIRRLFSLPARGTHLHPTALLAPGPRYAPSSDGSSRSRPEVRTFS